MMSEKIIIKNLKMYMNGQLGKRIFTVLFFVSTVAPYLNQHPLHVSLSAFFLLILGLILKKSPPKIIHWSVALGCGTLVYSSYGTLRGLEPGLSLLIYFAVLKTWELKKERDLFIMFLISILLLVGHLLNLYSLLGLLHLFVSSVMMIFLMMMFHREESWQWPNAQKRRAIYLMVAMSVPQAVFLFVFFPRFYVGHFNFSSTQMKSKLGFTDRLRPGEVSEIITSTDPVFRVNFFGDQRPTGRDLYWRGATLNQADGFNWDRGESWEISREGEREGEKGESEINYPYQYQVHFATQERGIGFTLAYTEKVDLLGRGRVRAMHDDTYQMTPFSNSKMRYKVWGLKGQEPEPLSEQELELYLQLPEDLSERFKNFINDRFSSETSPEDKASKLMRYFREEDFVYTLRPEPYLGQSALEEFFFDKRRGFCEHYASATALAFRLMGIPTRVVTGFQGGLYNSYGDFFVIRGEDAHAWVEAYFEDQGWVRFDPVEAIAPQRIEFGARDYFLSQGGVDDLSFQDFLGGQSDGFTRDLLMRFDATYFALNQAFISFDYDAQLSAFKNWGLPELSPEAYLFISFTGAGLVGLFFFPYFLGQKKSTLNSQQRVFRKFLTQLEKLGFIRADWMSLEKFSEFVCQDTRWSEQQKEQLSKIFQYYLELRFKRQIDEAPQHAQENLDKLKNMLNQLEFKQGKGYNS